MKRHSLSFLFILALALTGCKTLQFSSQPVSDGVISPMKTFAVTPPNGGYDFLNSSSLDTRAITINAIATLLEKRGYTQVQASESPDFIVNSLWTVMLGNNPEYLLNAGSPTTAEQIPSTEKVASLDVYVISGTDGRQLWRGSSAWPFSVQSATAMALQSSVNQALTDFPTQEAKLAEITEK